MIRAAIILGLVFLISLPAIGAETATEFGIGTGYTDNLFNDSTGVTDSYTSPYLGVSFYPSSSIEISFSGIYTAFSEAADLSSVNAGGTITYVSAGDNRPISFYLSAGSTVRRYGDLYRDYDAMQSSFSAVTRFRLSPKLHLKLGGAFSSNDFDNSVTGDNHGFGAFGGVNGGLWGSNTIDIEGGVDFTSFESLDSSSVMGWRNTSSSSNTDIENDLQTAYISVRLSRPLGSHTGIAVEYAARSFIGSENVVTYGLTLDNLSPWTAFWEGQAISAEVKSFIIPNFIVNTGVRYQQARFMDALELDNTGETESYSLQTREDDRMQTSLSLQRPIVIGNGRILRPTINISYIDNNSTHPYYDYEAMSMSLTLDFQF